MNKHNHARQALGAVLSLLLIAGIAACSAATATGVPATTTASEANGGANGTPVPGEFQMPPLTRLAYGTLALEDSAEAVTAEQAASLLPLWQAVQALGQSDTTAEAELTALENQIERSYTPEQVSAIDAILASGQNLQDLMAELGLDFGGPGNFGNGTPAPDFTPGAGGFGDGGGPFFGDGGPPGDGGGGGGFGGGPGGGGFNPQDLDPDQLATLQAGRGTFGGRGNNVPPPVMAALLALLETRSGG